MSNTVEYGSNIPFQDGKSILIFNHIQKCGGTTLNNILSSSLGQGIWFEHQGATPRALKKLRNTTDVSLVTGHYCWGIHEHIDPVRPVHYLTMLRNPINLCKSHYNYHVKMLWTSMPFDVYVRRYYENNPLTRHLGGGDVGLAMERLEKHYLFGILESFESSLEMFARFLPLKLQGYAILNYSASERLSLEDEDLKSFKHKNQDDIALYGWARELFARRLNELGIKSARSSRNVPAQAVTHNADVTKLLSLGKYEDAALKMDAENRHGADLMAMAECLRLAGNPGEQIARIVREWRKNHCSGLTLAFTLYDYGKLGREKVLDREIERHRPLVTRTPDSVINNYLIECLIMKANLRWIKHEDKAGAEKYFNEALGVNPRNEALCLNVAKFFNSAGMPQTALDFIKKNLSSPKQPYNICEKYITLGEIHSKLKDGKNALHCFLQANIHDYQYHGLETCLYYLIVDNLPGSVAINIENASADILRSETKKHSQVIKAVYTRCVQVKHRELSDLFAFLLEQNDDLPENQLVLSFLFGAYRNDPRYVNAVFDDWREIFPKACAMLSGAFIAMRGEKFAGEGDPVIPFMLGSLLRQCLTDRELDSARWLILFCLRRESNDLRKHLALLLEKQVLPVRASA